MKKITELAFLTVFCALLSGCATKMTVMAGLSENIKEYYSIYPSVEIDVAAVTEEEADELKKVNADNYFSVGNAMRKSLTPYTFMFSAEQTAPQTMKYNVPQWDKWLEKEPKKIAVIANMPLKEEGGKGKDARVLILKMTSGFMHHKKFYVEAQPGSVVRIFKEPTDPEKIAERKKKEAEKLRRKEAERKAKEREAAEKKAAEERKAAEKKALNEKKAADKKAATDKKAAGKENVREGKPAGKKNAKTTKSAGKKANAPAANKTTPNKSKG